MREGDPVAACLTFGIPVSGPPEVLPGTFPATTFATDLLLKDPRGDLAHVEYMRSSSADLVARMLIYRGLIMRTHGRRRLRQFVVLLGQGEVSGHDDLAATGFALEIGVVKLREMEPEKFLTGPALAPLAVLAKGTPASRAEALKQVFQVITVQGGARVAELLECAAVLATIRLDPPTIVSVVEEAGMSVEAVAELFAQTEVGQVWLRQGREAGLEAGLEAGREEGRERVIEAVLHAQFGDDPRLPAAATLLARRFDDQGALRAVNRAKSLDELLAEA